MDGDQIAYAVQASEAAYIVKAPDVEIETEILMENFNHTDESLYIAFRSEYAQILKEKLAVGNGRCEIKQIEVQFEVKHLYFDNLHRAVEGLSSEVIAKLVPEATDFKEVGKGRIPFPKHYENILRLDENTPCDQVKALRVAAFAQPSAPPVLISGAFGTGKTRLLAAATHFFLQEGKQSSQITRVLVCAHHQASADTFLECYFGIMKNDSVHPWRVELARITSEGYRYNNQEYLRFYSTINQFKDRSGDYVHENWLLIITTCLTSLRLRGGDFDHRTTSIGY